MTNHRSGSEVAYEEWEQGRARTLTTKTFQRVQPSLPQDSLFYWSSVGAVDWGPKFCDEYNAEIARLIEERGVPDWAPGLRRLMPTDCQAALAKYETEDTDFLSDAQRWLVARISGLRDSIAPVSAVAHIPDRGLLLTVRRTPQRLYFDVFDLLELKYMSHYIVDS
ncbi:hypothetical protein [Enhygromyxa salina]|uniref:hypothetical protein n=1 Tax=Enhygromyxa salina TaxID=215803 RepID=UPI0013FCFB2B|nr:hypothetical protein [Enhygromyxa salina]